MPTAASKGREPGRASGQHDQTTRPAPEPGCQSPAVGLPKGLFDAMKTMTLAAGCAALLTTAAAAHAGVEARIDVTTQRMTVTVDGAQQYSWAVSTGRHGFDTPRGAWTTERMYARYFSRKYDNAPMPYAVFFTGGIAVHGTSEVRNLGRPASHGCVRLHPRDAKLFFSLVREHGLGNSRVVVTD